MGSQASKLSQNKNIDIKNKSEKDLPKRERKAMKKLLKTNPHLKEIPIKAASQMTPREWIQSKLGFYYVEPFLTDVSEWTDNRYPREGSFDKNKLSLIREYLTDNSTVPNPKWDREYMMDVLHAWELMSKQWPGNIVKAEKKKRKKINIAMAQEQVNTALQLDEDKSISDNKPPIPLYPVLDICQSPPEYESEEDSEDWIFLCTGGKPKSYAPPKVIPTIIFAENRSDDKRTQTWKEQCAPSWIKNCKAAFDIIDRKHNGDANKIHAENIKYIKECMACEFKRMVTLIRRGHEIEINDVTKVMVNNFKIALKRYEKTANVILDFNTQTDSKHIKGIIGNISETEAEEMLQIVKLCLKMEREQREKEGPSQSKQDFLTTPLIVLEDKVMDKPLALSEVSRIVRDAPSPLTNPTAFLNWWTTALLHSSLSGKDVRYILATLIPQIKIDTLIEECNTLSYDNDGPIEGEYTLENRYPWMDRKYKEKHIQQLAEYLKKNAAQDRDVTQVLNCKRKPNEPMSEYAARFQKCWKEQAKLEITENEDPFFVSMFLNGLDQNSAYTLKIAAPDIYSFSPNALLKKTRELDAVGLFTTIPKNKLQATQAVFENDECFTALQNVPQRGRGVASGYRAQGQNAPPCTDQALINSHRGEEASAEVEEHLDRMEQMTHVIIV